MKLSRRQLLKVGGGTAAGLATAGMVELGRPQQVQAKVVQDWKIRNSKQVAGICPYCAVGCATLTHVREKNPGQHDWEIVNVEGHPDSPINAGTLCPKGAASIQLAINRERATTALYRAPGSDKWEAKPLEWMYDELAKRIKATRDANWQATFPGPDKDGKQVDKRANRTMAIGTLGGATMDNEWNYIHSKLMRSLGVVYVENQARI